MLRIAVSPCDRGAGFALLAISGWSGTSDPKALSLQRNQDQYYLNTGREWSSTPVWHDLPAMTKHNDGAISAIVGPNIIDALLASPNSVFLGSVSMADGTTQIARVDLQGQLLGSSAIGSTPTESGSGTGLFDLPQAEADPDPAPSTGFEDQPVDEHLEEGPREEVHQEEVPQEDSGPSDADTQAEKPPLSAWQPQKEPEPEKENQKEKKKPILLMAGGAAAALLILAGSAFLFLQEDETPVPAPPPAPCAFDGFQTANADAFIQACIETAPDAADLIAFYDAAVAEEQCDVARKVMTYFAQNGNNDVALEYARRFDPVFHEATACIAEADEETAAYWYEGPARVEDVLAMRRLGQILASRGEADFEYGRGVEYLEKAAAAGDADAQEALEELRGN